MRKYLPTVSVIIGTTITLMIIFALANATGFTGLIISPVDFIKNKLKPAA